MIPPTPTETRSEALARWESMGYLDPECPSCREFYDTPMMPWDVFAPRHRPSKRCESGSVLHCACDTCF